MPNKKKKVSSCFQKQNEAHHKNIFLKKVIEIAKVVSENDAYKLLNSKILNNIYNQRFRPFRLVADPDLNIPAKDLQDLKELLTFRLKNRFVKLGNKGWEVDLYDFFGPGISLWQYLRHLHNNKQDSYPLVVDAFKAFAAKEDILNDAINIFKMELNFINWQMSSFDKKIISIKMSFKALENDPCYLYTEARIQGYQAETIHVTLNGNTRPAFRLGIGLNGGDLSWVDFPASELGLHQFHKDTKIPIYIQHHAIDRLNERLDCVRKNTMVVNLVNSIDTAKIIQHQGKKLVEFNYFNKKIGYLMIDLIDGVAVIRTFLLLTHSCTPEGDNLRKILGFEKQDISYLNLDKLSTFVHSNLRDNQLLCDLFSKAGCKSLLEVQKHDYDKECQVTNASIIESYFNKYHEYAKNFELPEMELETAG